MDFKDRLREIRTKTGITAKDFAAIIGVKYTTYISYEKTGNTPSMENLAKIATALNVSVDQLLGVTGGEAITNHNRLDYWTRYLKQYGYELNIDHKKQEIFVYRRGEQMTLLAPGIPIADFVAMMDTSEKTADNMLADTRAGIITLLLEKYLQGKNYNDSLRKHK